MLVGQGIAGQIEICLMQDAQAKPLQEKLSTDFGYMVRAGLISTAVVVLLGSLVRNGYLPAIPFTVLINALVLAPALGFVSAGTGFVRSVEHFLLDAGVALSKRQAHLGFWMPASILANRFAMLAFVGAALWLNEPLFATEGRFPVNPYIGFAMMAFCYMGAAWHVYMARLVRATQQCLVASKE